MYKKLAINFLHSKSIAWHFSVVTGLTKKNRALAQNSMDIGLKPRFFVTIFITALK
jgi:hypothetical protein